MTPAARRWILAVFVSLAAMGFLLPLWPLSVLGVALLSLSGRWFAALCLGALLDLAWGTPVGPLHVLVVPFVLTAVVFALVRLFAAKYFINTAPPERL